MKTKMTPAEVMVEYLDVTADRAVAIMQACDTTFTGTKWNEAAFRDIIMTAKTVNKAIDKIARNS